MDLSKFTSADQLRGAITDFESIGMPVPQEMRDRLAELEVIEAQQKREEEARIAALQNASSDDDFVDSNTPIYDTLVKKAKFKPGPEKKKCIFDSVNYLMEEGDDATQPGLLLGRIQCGKTDTFVKIMALAFDKGIDVCVVFTKGTNALADQTVSRMKDDFEPFEWTDKITRRPIVSIFDIMEIKDNGLTKAEVNRQKIIIICKKEDDNLKHLIRLFEEKQPLLKDKNVLIVDDEADFASWNYMKRHGEISLAVITKLINQFVHTPKFCRYLQVTATPYSLYLQPDQSIEIEEDGYVRPMKPRFTTIVPTHDAYVGGDHYFIKSQDEESMYSYLFHPISDDCMRVMKNKNNVYLRNMLTSDKIYDFRHAILSYLMATVIRKIQEIDAYIEKHPDENLSKDDVMFEGAYKSSCLIHLQVSQDKQVWQETLILDLVQKIKEAYCSGETEYFDALFEAIYQDFMDSNTAAREYDKLITAKMPSIVEVRKALVEALDSIEPNEIVHVVNSDRGVKELLDKKNGQLKLTSLFNIFIGGSILDRGITINNMLSFFYGRTTSSYQQDTVLQHMRQYGSRSKEDMAVTRLHTTYDLYDILELMNAMDNQLRDWLINEGNNDPDMKAVFVGLAPGTKIQPCSKGKIVVSDTVTITPGTRLTTSGFQTGPKSTISKIVDLIDAQLKALPNYKEDEFFEVDKWLIYEILDEIRSTYVYDEKPGQKWGNYGFDWNTDDMKGLLEYCTGSNSDTVMCMVRTGMDMSRVRSNGRFVDAPETGKTDGEKARAAATEKPAILLFRENGSEEKGWRGTPFYWPVAYASMNIDPVVFTAGAYVPEYNVADIDLSQFLDGAQNAEVLRVQCRKEDFDAIESGEGNELLRAITDATANKYLVPTLTGRSFEIDPEAISDESELSAGIHTYNEGKFPFLVHQYEYLLLWCKGKGCYRYMLAQVDPVNPYVIKPAEEDTTDDDLLVFPDGDEIEVTYNNFVIWTITYKVKKVKVIEFEAKPRKKN